MGDISKDLTVNELKLAKTEDVHFDPPQIPTKIWEKIFSYSDDTKDLLNLSLACKLFYETIKAQSDLMERFNLHLRKDKAETKKPQFFLRNYTKISLCDIKHIYGSKDNNEKHGIYQYSPTFEKFGPELRVLQSYNCKLAPHEWVYIFSHCNRKLKTLRFECCGQTSDVDLELQQEPNIDKFSFTELENVKFLNFSVLACFKFIPNTIRNFKIACCNFKNEELEDYSTLLTRQNCLTSLKLRLSYGQFSILDIFDGTKMNFKLEILEVILDEHLDITKTFQKFLKSQSGSLKSLKLVNLSVHKYENVFNFMPKLESLDFRCKKARQYRGGSNFRCPSLKKFLFEFGGYPPVKASFFSNFIKRFNDVEEIFVKMYSTKALMKTISENFPNLKILTIYNYEDKHFEGTDFKRVLELNIIYSKESSDIIMENVLSSFENLEVLRIYPSIYVFSMSLLWLLEYFKKLKYLELSGYDLKVKFLSKKLHLFKNLTVVKIINTEEQEELKNFFRQFPNLKLYFETNKSDTDGYYTECSSDEYYSDIGD